MFMDMTCEKFEESLASYLDKELDRGFIGEVAGHALRCSGCHALLDDVKARLRESDPEPGLFDSQSTLPGLEITLETIPIDYAEMDCTRFEELVTEFLDGYVPATLYHRFGEHSASCQACSRLLTEVVYAVAACHSVHTYEEMEVPEVLASNLLGIVKSGAGPGIEFGEWTVEGETASEIKIQASRLQGLIAIGLDCLHFGRSTKIPPDKAFSRGLSTGPLAVWPRIATATAIVATTFGLILSGFSADLTLKGIYHKAQVRVASIYRPGFDIRSERAQLESRFEQVGSDFNHVFKTLSRVGAGDIAQEDAAGGGTNSSGLNEDRDTDVQTYGR
jgi:hypothetical protein